MDMMAEIRQTFFEECAEGLTELEVGLLAIENGEAEYDTVNAVFRAVHSIKGGAGAFGCTELVQFAHSFETTLGELRSNRLQATPEVVKVMLRAADVLSDLVAAARDGGTADAARTSAVTEELRAAIGAAPEAAGAHAAHVPAAASDEPDDGMDGLDFTPVAIDFSEIISAGGGFRVGFRPKAALYRTANEPAVLLREVLALGRGTVSCDVSDVPLLDAIEPEGAYLGWTVDLEGEMSEADILEIFDFVEADCELTVEAAAPAPSGDLDGDLASLLAMLQADGGDGDTAHVEPADIEPEAAAEEMPASTAAAPAAKPEATKPDVAAKPEAAAKADPEETKAAAGTGAPSPSIRVDLDRVDRLINLVGELVIQQVMLAQRMTQAGLNRASDVAVGLDELEQLTREIQDSVMAIRAQPVKSVFQKLPRLVREVSGITGKQVKLVVEGEYTEVDKTVIERLSDPLTHMIRNAIDHGIEAPAKRRAAGKSEEGTVRVAAMHRSGRIVIEIADDGAGINRKVVRDIAVTKGLVPAEAALSDDEIDNLIFLPGFSTKEQVSELSGRGVGMDVVKRSIQALGGRVSISSRPGLGSTFTMSLPLTLAVLDGMIVSTGEHTLVVPLTAIVETLKPKASDIRPFGRDAFLIRVRDKFLPVIRVASLLGYGGEQTDPLKGVLILVETENGSRSALLFDAIQGQRQVVIKSLETNYGRVPGVAAATILGDGRVALILDIDAVVSPEQTSTHASLQAAE